MTISSKASIFVTGHRGMVGSAVVRALEARGHEAILTATRKELDLRDQRAVSAWFETHRPDYVIHVAGLVGGILANSTRQADFLYDNMMMHATVLHAAHATKVQKLLYLGSSCIYPRDCPQPIREEYLLTGPLEETNYGYAIAKIAGLKSCQAYRDQYGSKFIAAMPTNLYGPNDNFDLKSSHVLPALLRKMDDARREGQPTVSIWGSGKPCREFLHVDDLANACLFLLEQYDEREIINVGSGEEVTIAQLAETLRDVIYPEAKLEFDASRPDGTPRKLLDCSKLHALGWTPGISLAAGISHTYDWYQQHANELRGVG